MTEESQRDRPQSKRKKHIVLLVLGLLMTGIAEGFALRNPNAYTAGALAAIFLSRPIIYFVVLGVISLIASAVRNNVRKYWFPILAWLFLAAGVFDLFVGGYTNLILRPKIDRGIQELVESGKLDISENDQKQNSRDRAEVLNAKGMSLLERGSLDPAIARFRTAADLAPQWGMPRNNIGIAHYDAGRLDSALQEFNEAIRLQPALAVAYSNQALVHFQKRQYDLAVHDCTKALEIDPSCTTAYVTRAGAYSDKHMDREAIADCTKALEIDPTLVEALHMRACVYALTKEYGKAKADADTIRRLGGSLTRDLTSLLDEVTETVGTAERGQGTAINDLAERGDMDGIKRMLAENPGLARAREAYGWGYTPLHNAVARHNTQLVKYLLDFGVDVNIEARSGETPLVTAAGEADADICFLLIDKGAHPFGTAEAGETALHFAAMENLPEVATKLLSIGAKRVAMNKDGETPLDWARQYNNPDVERVLRK